MPKLPPVEVGYRLDSSLPVIPLAMRVNQAGCAAPHAHPRGQLIFASSGVMRVVCGRDIWMVPPAQAVWVPPGAGHEVYFPGLVSLRNLFVDPSACGGLPGVCTVLEVSPLLRELIARAVRIGESYAPDSPGFRLMLVLLDELRQAAPAGLRLPMGEDERLVRAMAFLLKNPGAGPGLARLARVAGASARTLARLCLRETGLTLGVWRKRLVLQEAVVRLGRGDSIAQVAFDLGYQSQSAFTAMFRQELGASPGRYLLRPERESSARG